MAGSVLVIGAGSANATVSRRAEQLFGCDWGRPKTFVVPWGISEMHVVAEGASGGSIEIYNHFAKRREDPIPGGKGGRYEGTFRVGRGHLLEPGRVLNVAPGCMGQPLRAEKCHNNPQGPYDPTYRMSLCSEDYEGGVGGWGDTVGDHDLSGGRGGSTQRAGYGSPDKDYWAGRSGGAGGGGATLISFALSNGRGAFVVAHGGGGAGGLGSRGIGGAGGDPAGNGECLSSYCDNPAGLAGAAPGKDGANSTGHTSGGSGGGGGGGWEPGRGGSAPPEGVFTNGGGGGGRAGSSYVLASPTFGRGGRYLDGFVRFDWLGASRTSLTSSANPAQLGEPVTLTATVQVNGPQAPAGRVVFQKVDPASGVSSHVAEVPVDKNGRATHTTRFDTRGEYKYFAHYSGDELYPESYSSTVVQAVRGAETRTKIVSSAPSSPFGTEVAFVAEVRSPYASTPQAGYRAVAGTVDFYDNGRALGSAPLTGTATKWASVTVRDLPPGNHAIKAFYRGDDVFESSSASLTSGVTKAATTTTVSTSEVVDKEGGAEIELKATVTSESDARPWGTVIFYDGQTEIGRVTELVVYNYGQQPYNGTGTWVAKRRVTLASGEHHIKAVFEGTDRFEASASVSVAHEAS